MATQTITREIRTCDVCHCEGGYLRTCIVCNCEFCLTCDAVIAGCGIAPKVCRKCGKRDDVKALCDEASPKLAEILRERDKKIAALAALQGKT